MNLQFTKEDFIEYINFIKDIQEKQENFISALEALSPSCYCDAFIYAGYENKLLNLIQKILHDENDDINYKMWEFDQFDDKEKAEQLKETPWLESWEALYDHLVENMENAVL